MPMGWTAQNEANFVVVHQLCSIIIPCSLGLAGAPDSGEGSACRRLATRQPR